MTAKTEGFARSVHARLVRYAKEHGLDPSLVFTRYATERLLYRLSVSQHGSRLGRRGSDGLALRREALYSIGYVILYMESTVPTVKPTQDIQPLTAFRANVASFVDQVRQTGRPLVLTQHGKGAAVLLGAAEYESMVEELEILRDIQLSERELAEGRGIPHEQVVQELREIVRRRGAG